MYLCIYLFMAVLGLSFCARVFSSCGMRGPLFIAVRGPLTIMASLVAEHRLQTCRLSNCGSWAQSLHGMWDLPRPGVKPVSPALAGRFSTTAPPGKPFFFFLYGLCFKSILSHMSIVTPSFLSFLFCMKYLFPSPQFQFMCVLCPKVGLLQAAYCRFLFF